MVPVTTLSNHKKSPFPNLLQQEFECFIPNTVWLADITYYATEEGWLYVAAIKDMATREIVGWAMDKHMKASLCCDALQMALARRGNVTGLTHHSASAVPNTVLMSIEHCFEMPALRSL